MSIAHDHAIEIRAALPEDGAALMRLVEQVNRETEFLGTAEERLPWADRAAETIQAMTARDGGIYLLALRGSEPIGFLGAFAGAVQRTRDVLFVGHVGLRQAERGRGIGRRLFVAMEAWAKARGVRRIELRVDETNQPGRALYRRREFTVEGRMPDAALVDGAWHAHLWMAKILDAGTEPAWSPLDLAPPVPRFDVGRTTFRALRATDGAAMTAWERQMLGETPFLLKRPDEVGDDAEVARQLAAPAVSDARLRWVATTMVDGMERIVGHLAAWREPGERMRGDAFFGLNVLRDHWGTGIGRSLAHRLFDWAREHRLRRLSTAVQGHNRRGLRFAAALGFRPEIVSPRYAVIDGRAVDRVRLVKLLGRDA